MYFFDLLIWVVILSLIIAKKVHSTVAIHSTVNVASIEGLPKQQNLNISTANPWSISGKGIANGWGLGPDGQRLVLEVDNGRL